MASGTANAVHRVAGSPLGRIVIVVALLVAVGCGKHWNLVQTVQFGPAAPGCKGCSNHFYRARGNLHRYRYVASCGYEMITGTWWWYQGFNGGAGRWDGWTIISIDPGSPIPQRGDWVNGDLSGTGPRTVNTFNPDSGRKVNGIHIEVFSHETTDKRFIGLGCLKKVP